MSSNSPGLNLALFSLHGLLRAENPELGHDADTGGQVKYVLELATALTRLPEIGHVQVITRQIIDEKIGAEYAALCSPINDKAELVRIPFGPRRYLRKESLWPYVDACVDASLAHFRRSGVPDLIHGHYADAGYVGAQLARLLGCPFVFTGHSLGRVKRARLLAKKGVEPAKLEERYAFTTRIEAEELALETASLVVTSTQQEVEEQYQLYDHYVPDRMEVIPPGVDLQAFRPPSPEDSEAAPYIDRFLAEPDKPWILALARLDERKNLSMLVDAYGSSPELQKLANLVLVMGSRDDVLTAPPNQRRVLTNILSLIDKYDLYGKIAYPKSHPPDAVPGLYRMAAVRRGVFINPALTEPFGLTLLEAAGTGLPVVATNDGGPRDILANCQHGLLVDPLDREAIQHALLRALTEDKQWDEWSSNGKQRAPEHYSWTKHAQRFFRDVQEVIREHKTPVVAIRRRTVRRMPDVDRVVVADVDGILEGDEQALTLFTERLQDTDARVGFGITTGRNYEDVLEKIEHLSCPEPDLLITSAGTEVYYANDRAYTADQTWLKQLQFQWKPEPVKEVLADIEGLYPQADAEQSLFKISYQLDPKVAPSLARIRTLLREAGLRVKVILSWGIFLDVIPVRAGSGLSLRHVSWKWGINAERLLVAGDAGNDEEMLRGNTLGVVVANHGKELERLRGRSRIYFAEGAHARGLIEGIDYYSFFDHVQIPNDRV